MDETELLRKKRLQIGNEMMSAVRSFFPKDASIECHIDLSSENYVAKISWKLCDDKNRQNKISKTILITKEFIEDSDFSNKKQKVLDQFKKYIDCKMKSFDYAHNGDFPPEEEWRYSSSEN